jgi:hypothetical protein
MLYLNIGKEICLIFFSILLFALTYIFLSYLKIIGRSFLTSLLCKCHQEWGGRRKSAGSIFLSWCTFSLFKAAGFLNDRCYTIWKYGFHVIT